MKFQRLAAAGGGQVYFIHPDQDLSGVYAQILSELRSQYTVAFYPRTPRRADAWRQDRGRGEREEGPDGADGERSAARP